MLPTHFTTLGFLGWAVHALAQGRSQNCAFALISDDAMLSQLPGGQVLGVSTTHNTSADVGGILFRLQDGQLYDSQFRACWWVGRCYPLFLPLSASLFPPSHSSPSPITPQASKYTQLIHFHQHSPHHGRRLQPLPPNTPRAALQHRRGNTPSL
jgi:hypothetical protein